MTAQPSPPSPPHPNLDELIGVLERLRAPGGCAWDREQTHQSLVRYLIEETHELVDAIETGTRDDLIEELGDVLYQVIFHADIAAHTPGEKFTLEDVAAHMTAKMVGRHPHVFGDTIADTPDAVMANWETLKAEEKPHRSSTLDGVPQRMPSLLLADKLIGKAAALGVATASVETATVQDASAAATDDELGDLLLTLVTDAKSRGLDAERALRARLRQLEADIRAAEASEASTA